MEATGRGAQTAGLSEAQGTVVITKHVLFVCGRNRRRSPTAEAIFADHPGVEVASAGLSPESETPLDSELLNWADMVFVMERNHRSRLTNKFGRHVKACRIVCLDIPDHYEFMDTKLIAILRAKVTPILNG